MAGWQPIETAPKDGEIDVWCVHKRGWKEYDCRAVDACYDPDRERWFGRDGAQCLQAYNVTHWMPKPKPPTANK